MSAPWLKRLLPHPRWAVISVPYVWLLLFFAIPFLIVLKISFSTLAIAMPPYTPVLEMTTPITDVWKSYCGHRVATSSLPANGSNVSIHLATAKQVIELGPVFVFNFGKGYNRAKLKGCDA